MKKRVIIKEENEVFNKAIFRVVEAKLQHELFSGRLSDTITRLSFERGDSVAMLVHNPVAKTLFMTEQFRYPVYDADDDNRDGWLLEVPAGIIEPDENPVNAIGREVLEEIGYEITRIEHIANFFVSPGGSSERINLYYAPVNLEHKLTDGGGVVEEGENIRVVELTVSEAIEMMKSGNIVDAKTIIALQWLMLNKL